MKKIISIITIAVILSSCERDLDSEGVVAGEIRFPSITLNGSPSIALLAGTATSVPDPGAVVLLGTDDISDQLVVTGIDQIDFNTPGAYPITYSVTTTNELGDESTVTDERYVVIMSEDVANLDLAGNYSSISMSFGGASFGQTMSCSKLGPAYFSVSDIYAHPAANNPGRFVLISSTEGVLIPQSTSETIFGLTILGTVDVNAGNTDPSDFNISFNLNLVEAAFNTVKSWTNANN